MNKIIYYLFEAIYNCLELLTLLFFQISTLDERIKSVENVENNSNQTKRNNIHRNPHGY